MNEELNLKFLFNPLNLKINILRTKFFVPVKLRSFFKSKFLKMNLKSKLTKIQLNWLKLIMISTVRTTNLVLALIMTRNLERNMFLKMCLIKVVMILSNPVKHNVTMLNYNSTLTKIQSVIENTTQESVHE